MMLHFVVAGRPAPQPKPRSAGAHRFYPAKSGYKQYRQEVTDAAQFACAELEERGEPWDPRLRSYTVRLRFVRPDRRSTDIDRLTSTILDALTKAGVLEDDRYVDKLVVDRNEIDPARPRVEVVVQPYRGSK